MPILSVMPSNYLILCHPLPLPPSVFPSIRVFSNESDLRITWPKYWSFSFIISPSQRRQWQSTPVLLPGKSHGQRSLVGCSPWGREESDMTEQLHVHFSPSCIGEGNGNPLQCSCLENPRDGGAWWTAVYGVTQSQTQLKQPSHSATAAASVLPMNILDWFPLGLTGWISSQSKGLSIVFSNTTV